MSGTSADGISAVAVKISGSRLDTNIEIMGFETYPYPPKLREALFRIFTPKTSNVVRICEMNFVIGEFLAEATISLADDSGFELEEIDLIGSHGQTIHHLPKLRESFGFYSRSTLQIGEPALIARKTGIHVVADFRKADIAAGGEGAPLTPYLDFVMHRHPNQSRVFQNIGGIANLTFLPAGCTTNDVVAFDTGPGNMVIDAIVNYFSKGSMTYDKGGCIASQGKADIGLLDVLLSHPYFSRRPPKTTGREEFGKDYASKIIEEGEKRGLGFEDLLATATALTVESIARSYEALLPRETTIDEVFVSGGGAKNRFLFESLTMRMDPTPVMKNDQLGIPGEAKEAVLMAVLANEFILGNPANLPKATGAEKAVVLGALYPA
jgi:anhydro-N-acetylmuramic acid kinase